MSYVFALNLHKKPEKAFCANKTFTFVNLLTPKSVKLRFFTITKLKTKQKEGRDLTTKNRHKKLNKPSHKATPSSASKSVRRPTLYRGRSGRAKKVSFRLPVEVYVLLRQSVPNVSGFLRRLVFSALERLPVYFEMEEFWLEVEVARLIEELEKVHRWQKLVLKHGSYAEAYLQELKGGVVRDRKPHFLPKPPPFVKPEELVTVEDIVKYREALAKRLVQLLRRLMELKLSRSRDTQSHATATTNKR